MAKKAVATNNPPVNVGAPDPKRGRKPATPSDVPPKPLIELHKPVWKDKVTPLLRAFQNKGFKIIQLPSKAQKMIAMYEFELDGRRGVTSPVVNGVRKQSSIDKLETYAEFIIDSLADFYEEQDELSQQQQQTDAPVVEKEVNPNASADVLNKKALEPLSPQSVRKGSVFGFFS